MIRIKISTSEILVEGHAYYGPDGYDIVCAATSMLLQSLIASLNEFTDDLIKYSLSKGSSYVNYKNDSSETDLLIRSFILGCSLLADEYPNHVKLAQELMA